MNGDNWGSSVDLVTWLVVVHQRHRDFNPTGYRRIFFSPKPFQPSLESTQPLTSSVLETLVKAASACYITL
jgi:hypothetical protein